jgi:CheY-like chemotaxis protein
VPGPANPSFFILDCNFNSGPSAMTLSDPFISIDAGESFSKINNSSVSTPEIISKVDHLSNKKLIDTVMQKSGPIIVIEDDSDDQEILAEVFKNLNYPNEIIFFLDGYKALEYITDSNVQPFLILSDINMPKLNGFELRRKIHNNEELRVRCIPYLFFTSGADRKAVTDAYSMSAQGFFIKPSKMGHLENTIRKIVDYWLECYAPNQYH